MPALAPGGSTVESEAREPSSPGSAPAEIIGLIQEDSAEDPRPITHEQVGRQERPQQDPRSEGSDEVSYQSESMTSSQRRNPYGVDSGDIPTMYELYGVHTEDLPTHREMGTHTDSDAPHHSDF